MVEYCVLCGKKNTEEYFGILKTHHISYFPERTILVCASCHQSIHLETKFSYLKRKMKGISGLILRKK